MFVGKYREDKMRELKFKATKCFYIVNKPSVASYTLSHLIALYFLLFIARKFLHERMIETAKSMYGIPVK
jgi:hypothetical protein